MILNVISGVYRKQNRKSDPLHYLKENGPHLRQGRKIKVIRTRSEGLASITSPSSRWILPLALARACGVALFCGRCFVALFILFVFLFVLFFNGIVCTQCCHIVWIIHLIEASLSLELLSLLLFVSFLYTFKNLERNFLLIYIYIFFTSCNYHVTL